MNARSIRTLLARALILAVALGVPSIGIAQETRHTAAEALEAAVLRYDEDDYVGAQHALNQIDERSLDEDGRERLSEYQQLAGAAVRQQQKADLDHAAGLQAVSDGRLEDALRLFQSVLGNTFASRETQNAAQAELEALAVHQAVEGRADQPTPAADATAAQPAADLTAELRALRAKVLTREANEALDAARTSEAERLFNKALSQIPGYPEAVEGLERLGQHELVAADSTSLIERITTRNRIAWERTVTMYRTAEREVRDLIRNEQFNEAMQVVLRAQQVVEAGKRFATPVARYEAMVHDVDQLQRYVEQEERIFHSAEVQRQRKAAILENDARLRSVQENRDRRIRAWMDEAVQLRNDRQYEEAINVLKQVQAFAPTNRKARWMMDILEDRLSYEQQQEIRDQLYKQTQGALIDVERAKIPWWDWLTYPKNWPEIISRPTRGVPGSRHRDPNLQSRLDQPIDIDFQQEPFHQAVQHLADAGKVPISVAWSDLDTASIARDTPVTLKLASVPLGTVLREVVEQVGGARVELGYEVSDGIVKVATRERLDRNVYQEVYDITDLLMPIPDFTGAPKMDLVDPASFVGRSLGTNDEARRIFERGETGEVDRLASREQAHDLIALIRTTIMPDSWRANNGNFGSIMELNGQLVVTQTPGGQARVGGLLAKLREQRAVQVAIEARFLTVQSNYLEELGLDLDIVLNAGNAGFDFIENPGNLGSLLLDPLLGNRLLLPRSFSRLGIIPAPAGFGTTLGQGTTPGQPFSLVGVVPQRGNNFIGGGRSTPFPIVNNVLQFTNPANLSSDLPGSFAGNPGLQPALSVFGSILDNIQVDFLIRATKANSRTLLMTAPRLTLFNGQRSWIAVVNQQSFVSSLLPIVNATGALPNVQTVETGAVLDVQAVVSADRRYVTMTLRPSVGRLLGIQTFAFQTGAAAGQGNFLQLPNITRQVVRTTVTVPDGGTLLIGGQKVAGEIEIEAGVPILSDIPILKRFYNNRTLVKDEQVLLILIKPKIIIQREAEREAFPTFGSR